MHCINCGALLEPEAKFCADCGTPVITTQASENRLHKGMVTAAGLIVAGSVLGLIARFTMMRSGSLFNFRLVYSLIGLLTVSVPFVLAYYSSISRYRTLLLGSGIVLVAIHLFYFLTNF